MLSSLTSRFPTLLRAGGGMGLAAAACYFMCNRRTLCGSARRAPAPSPELTTTSLDQIMVRRLLPEASVGASERKALSGLKSSDQVYIGASQVTLGDVVRANNGAVIMAMRRPGCTLCREGFKNLRTVLQKNGQDSMPPLVTVTYQTPSMNNSPLLTAWHEQDDLEAAVAQTTTTTPSAVLEGQLAQTQWYLDESKELFSGPLLEGRWMGLVKGVLTWESWTNIFRARKDKEVAGTFEGEGRLLGGVLVVKPTEDTEQKHDLETVFFHREEVWGDHPSSDQLECALLTHFGQEKDQSSESQ